MGTIASVDSKQSEEDPRFLKLQSSAFFNDQFICSLVEQLPLYGYPDTETEKAAENVIHSPNDLRLEKMLSVLAHDPDSKSQKVEDHDLTQSTAESGFHVMNMKRTRVLLRVFQAYSGFLKDFTASSSQDTLIRLPRLPTDCPPADSMVALSIGMTLTLAKSLGASSAPMLAAMLTAMLDMLATFRPLSLGAATHNLAASISELLAFAKQGGMSSDPAVKGLSISLQLSLGLLTGSVATIAGVAHALAAEALPLHTSSVQLLTACAVMEPAFVLDFPSNKYVTDKVVSLPQEMSAAQNAALKANTSLVSLAADGPYFYIYNGLLKSIQKIGSGIDSIPGDAVAHNTSAVKDVYASIDKDAVVPDEVHGKIAVFNHKVYLHLKTINPTLLAVFDSETLAFIEMVDLAMPINAFLNSHTQFLLPAKESGRVTFAIDLTKPATVHLRAITQYTLKVVKATVDSLHDVTAAFNAFVRAENQILHVAEVEAEVQRLLQLQGVTAWQPLQLTIEVEYALKRESFGKLLPPLGCDGKNLMALYAYPMVPQDDTNGQDIPRIYDMMSLEITSAYYGQTNHTGVSVLSLARELWVKFLGKQEGESAATDTEGTPVLSDYAQLTAYALAHSPVPSPPAADTDRVFINYSIAGTSFVGELSWCNATNWIELVNSMVKVFDKTQMGILPVLINKAFSIVAVGKALIKDDTPSTIEQCDILYNSYQFIVLHSRVMEDEETKVLLKATRYASTDSEAHTSMHNKQTGLPSAFAYDINNNYLLGYDAHANAILRWSNSSHAPVCVEGEGLLAMSPSVRVLTALQACDYSNVLYGLIEKLSEPFGVSHTHSSTQGNEIKICAKTVGDSNKCSIVFNGIPIVFDDEFAEHVGYHVAVFSPDFVFQKAYLFDNESEPTAPDRMAHFIDSLPRNTVVCIANNSCLFDHMLVSHYASLMSLGLVDLDVLNANDITCMVAVGRKGLLPGQAEMVTGKGNEGAAMSRTFPAYSIPLAVDTTPGALEELLKICTSACERVVNILPAVPEDKLVLAACSMLRVLQVHVHQLSPKVLEVGALKAYLLTLIRSPLMSHAYMEEGVLSLFICAFDLFYPSQADQVGLISQYATIYSTQTLTATEEKVLVILLQRFQSPKHLLFVEAGRINYSYAKDIFNSTVKIIDCSKQQTIFTAAVSLLFALTKLLLACDSEAIFLQQVAPVYLPPAPSADQQFQGANGHGEMVFDILHRLSTLSCNMLSTALEDVNSNKDSKTVLNTLRSSPVGSVLPLAIMCLSGIVTRGSYKLLSRSLEHIVSIIESLSACLQAMNSLLATMPPESREYDNTVLKKATAVKVFESEHPYRSNMDETTLISFPGALSVLITFDSACRTEHDCDYIIFRDNSDEELHDGRFSGRDGNQNFPGIGNVPALTINKDEFKFLFHSDGSVEDWGYKFTAQATYPPKTASTNRSNWLLKLNFEIIHALSSIGAVLLAGPEKKPDEIKYAAYMENSLVKPELFIHSNGPPEDAFLLDLILRPPGGLGERFARIMKTKVMEDRGSIESINNAVYATCAAIIKANNLHKEAYAIATQTRSDISPTLCKAWKAGQKMRAYFDLKDVRAAIDGQQGTNEHSLYSGADSDVINEASQAIIARASFLLRSPADSSSASIEPQLSPFAFSVTPLSPKGDGSPDRWRLAAKAVALQRQISDDTRNVATMWHSLVDEVVVIDKLKNILMHRRKFAERVNKQLTMTEKVLQFIQQDIDIGKLEEINKIRNKRAVLRAKGIDVYIKLIDVNSYPFSVYIASCSFVDALCKIKHVEGLQSGAMHYMNDCEGCSLDQQSFLYSKYLELLKHNVSILRVAAVQLSSTEQTHQCMWKDAVLAILSACAIDYDFSDHSLVLESGLPDALESLLCDNHDPDISARCRIVLEILVNKFVVLDNSDLVSEPTDLSKRLVQILSSLLKAATGAVDQTSRFVTSEHGTVTIGDALSGQSCGVSYRLPAFDLHADHSFSFFIKRPASAVDSQLDPKDLLGMQVIRGMAWVEDKRSDGGLGSLGSISAYNVDTKTMRVKWPSNKECEYKFHLDNRQKSEVALADASIGGYLFSRGGNGMHGPSDRNVPFFSNMSAIVLPDASLLFVYQPVGKDPQFIRSKAIIPAGEWTQIVFACDIRFHAKLFIKDDLDVEADLGAVDLGSPLLTVESAHPVTEAAEGSQEFADAAKLVAIVDNDCAYDGELSFSQEKEGSVALASYQLGVAPAYCSALVVPGNRFDFKYTPAIVEEGTPAAEKWGYKLTLHGLTEKVAKQLSNVASKVPFYIGHPPSYMTSPVKSLSHGFEGLFAQLQLHNHALNVNDLRVLDEAKQAACLQREPSFIDEVGVISIFGILRKALDSLDNLSDTSLRRTFANSGLLDVLFDLLHHGSAPVKCAAYHVAAAILPSIDIVLVDGLASRHGLLNGQSSFLDYLIHSIGSALNSLSRRSESSSVSASGPLLESTAEQAAVVGAQIKLFREFASGHVAWTTEVSYRVQQLAINAAEIIAKLASWKEEEMSLPLADSLHWDKFLAVSQLAACDGIFALLAFFGYEVAGLYAGASVLYVDPSSGLSEESVVIGIAKPPVVVRDPKGKNKELVDKWDRVTECYGEAVSIALHSSPQQATVVPREQVKPHAVNKLASKFESYLVKEVGLESIVSLFEKIATVDMMDRRPKPMPIVKVEDKQLTFESEHPYSDNMDTYEEISFPGAEELIITFDENSLTETSCDYVQFFQSNARTDVYGSKYWGRGGDQNFPGFGGRPSLIVKASSLVLHFHSDGSNTDWGYKLTISAKIRATTEPPNMPALPSFTMLAQIKMAAMKTLYRLVETFEHSDQLAPAFAAVFNCAVAPRPANRVVSAMGGVTKEIIMESSHPYEDSLDTVLPVNIPGARRCTIVFDPETRTELNCDHLSFFLDEGRSTRVPDSEQYTGGKDGSNSNWPGFGGRAPLVIESDTFFIYFHSDGSVNDWGWRMFITADIAGGGAKGPLVVRGEGMDAIGADVSCNALLAITADGVPLTGTSAYKTMSKFTFEKAPEVNAFHVDASLFSEDAPSMVYEESKEEKTVIESKEDSPAAFSATILRVNEQPKKAVITLIDEVKLLAAPAADAEVSHTIVKDTVLYVLAEEGEWLHVGTTSEATLEEPGEHGWCLSRVDEEFCVELVTRRQFAAVIQLDDANANKDGVVAVDSKKKGKKVLNPMYGVLDSSANGSAAKALTTVAPSTNVLMQQDLAFIDTAVCDYALLAGILYANDCVSAIVSRWPSNLSFGVEQFGSLDHLLTYLNMFVSAQTKDSSATIEGIMDLLLLKGGDGCSTACSLLFFAVSVLRAAGSKSGPSAGAANPFLVSRGECKDFESMHPYDHNMNFDWKFDFPGAKRLEITFDARSATETGYDYITIFNENKEKKLHPGKITGYLTASDRHWPGVNVPKVVLEGEQSCVINFQSDGGTNDWGFKGTVQAVYEEPSKEALDKAAAERTTSQQGDYTRLSCWLIYFMATRKNLPTALSKLLFTVPNFRAILSFFGQASATAVKPLLIDVFVVFAKELTAGCQQLAELRGDLLALEQSLLSFAQELYSADTKDGSDLLSVSPTLQSVAQLLVSIDDVLFTIRHEGQGLGSAANIAQLSAMACDDGLSFFHAHAMERSVLRWDVRLEAFTSPPVFGLTASPLLAMTAPLGCNPHHMEIAWSQDALFVSSAEGNGVIRPFGEQTKRWAVGDVVSVVWDSTAGAVSFLLNNAVVGVAVGPPALMPMLEMDLRRLQLTFAMTLRAGTDHVMVTVAPEASSPTKANNTVCDWLGPLYDANSLLTSINNARIPPVIVGNKLLPYCSKKHKISIHLEAADLIADTVIEKEIDLAGAASVHLVLQELKLSAADQVEIVDSFGAVLLTIPTEPEMTGINANVDALILAAINKHFDDRSVRLSGSAVVAKTLSVGDRVQRGPAWRYGLTDGGIGSYGVVTKRRAWKDDAQAGATVKWENGHEGLYRFDYKGVSDVVAVSGAESSASALSSNGTWSHPGEYLKLRIRLVGEAERSVQAAFFPLYTASHCLAHPDFEAFRCRLSSLFITARPGLAALAKHINAAARKNGISRDELLAKKFSDLAPAKDDLIRSHALKELSEALAAAMDEEDMPLEVDAVDALDEFLASATTTTGNTWSGPVQGTLDELAYWAGINDFATEEEARMAAEQVPECNGFTAAGGVFSLRCGTAIREGDGLSWQITRHDSAADGATAPEDVEVAIEDAEDEDEEEEHGSESSSSHDEHSEQGSEAEDSEEDEEEEEGDEEGSEEDGSTHLFSEDGSSEGSASRSRSRSRSNSNSVATPVPSPRRRRDRTAGGIPVCGKCRQPCRRHNPGTWGQGWSCDWPGHQGANRFTPSDAVYGCETIGPCNWGICDGCWNRIVKKPAVPAASAQQLTKQLLSADTTPISSQYVLLQLLNTALIKALPFIDLTKGEAIPNTLSAMLSKSRDIILEVVKAGPFSDTLNATAQTGGMFDLSLSRFKAKKHINAGKTDSEGRWSVFAQAFRVMHYMPPRSLRRADRLYSTKFLGEHAQDAGGPYRESFDNYSQELQSTALPLLLRTPNGRHAVGYNREKFILHPNATSKVALSMLSFLGKLMGIAIRSKEFLALNIPAFIWKLLANETPTLEDLEGIDYSLVKSLLQLRDIEQTGIADAETFSSVFFETFTTISSDDRVVPLLPGGDAMEVTFDNRHEYVSLVLEYRLHEFDRQAAAIRDGLASIIPLHMLSLYTAEELEEMVCGCAEIDVSLLQSIAEYSGCSASDPHIVNFWAIMQSHFTNVERSAFIRFTWGRSRLPLTAASFTQRFKIQSFGKSPADNYFPLAHTCFFSIELPRYSTLEIMREKLLYAIFNCEAIDGDDTATGIAVAAMGWEEEEDEEGQE